MVHSSLSAFGYVVGGTGTVVRALMNFLTPDGTLVMPAHTWESVAMGRRKFDARTEPACVGSIAEDFRGRDDVVRSVHPTHSVTACGPAATRLTNGHEDATTPCGHDTPYSRLLDFPSQVLLFGVGCEANTLFHTLEAIVNAPYLMDEEPLDFTIVHSDGRTEQRRFRLHRPAVPRRFADMTHLLADRGVLHRAAIGEAQCYVIDVPKFRQLLLPAMIDDPLFLLPDDERSRWNRPSPSILNP